jgi:hypothetical protein
VELPLAYDFGPGHSGRQMEGEDEGSWKSSPHLDPPSLANQGTGYDQLEPLPPAP